ncbi:MAG: hypothetical protein ISR78_08790, partial [Spirochaetia bacterium]|nr:hypothetical protein [Spirochaetia bacterium]
MCISTNKKSCGSKTVSALIMLVLLASIFFVSCGLPKNPFIIDTVLEPSNSSVVISADSATNSLYFSINNIDEVFTNNGINFFYCYSNKVISLNNAANIAKSINTTTYNSLQEIPIGEDTFYLYCFNIGEGDTYSLPSLNIDNVLTHLAGNSSLAGKIQVAASGSYDVIMDLSLFLTSISTDNLLTTDNRFIRYTESGIGEESIILDPDDSDIPVDFIINEENYYLHIFGSYYANEPSYE